MRVEERKAIGKYLAPIYDSTSTRLRHTIATLERVHIDGNKHAAIHAKATMHLPRVRDRAASGDAMSPAHEALYRAAIAADNAWSDELRRLFGKRANDARYTVQGRGEPGTELHRLHDAAQGAKNAWTPVSRRLAGITEYAPTTEADAIAACSLQRRIAP